MTAPHDGPNWMPPPSTEGLECWPLSCTEEGRLELHWQLRLRAAGLLRDRLGSVPFYAKRAEKARLAGNEMAYWVFLSGSQGAINMPPAGSSVEEMRAFLKEEGGA